MRTYSDEFGAFNTEVSHFDELSDGILLIETHEHAHGLANVLRVEHLLHLFEIGALGQVILVFHCWSKRVSSSCK